MRADERTELAAPALTAGGAAAHLGVAVSTLRSWSRRYGLGPSRHEPGKHRRYDAADVARLEAMRTLVSRGVPPAAAARWVQQSPQLESGEAVVAARPPLAGSTTTAVNGMARAAHRFDAPALAEGIAEHLSTHGVVRTWEAICLPLLDRLTDGGSDEQVCVDVEHLLAWTITVALHRVPDAPRLPGTRVALLACAQDETHTLGLDALRAALAEHGSATRMLGATTPTEALVTASRRIYAGAVVIWSQTARTGRRKALLDLGANLPAECVVIAAGPGWPRDRLPPRIIDVHTLREAVLVTAGATAVTAPGSARPAGELDRCDPG
ncbi:MAG: MerR family transcriptional regulator [Pseudonocardia sp.]